MDSRLLIFVTLCLSLVLHLSLGQQTDAPWETPTPAPEGLPDVVDPNQPNISGKGLNTSNLLLLLLLRNNPNLFGGLTGGLSSGGSNPLTTLLLLSALRNG